VDLLDDLANPEASFSHNVCFPLWKEKHCLQLPGKSHWEPKPKPNNWGKATVPEHTRRIQRFHGSKRL